MQSIPGCGPPHVFQKYYATDDPKLWFSSNDKQVIFERQKSYIYKFNDFGFRCDNFSLPSEYPIVFLGCSNTCGVALPLQQTWPFLLLDKIKSLIGKKIPLWNLAAAGSSIDKQALLLERHVSRLRPKMVFFLIPSLYRRMIVIDNELVEYLPTHRSQLWRPDDVEKKVKKFDAAFTIEDFAVFESFKSLSLINRIAMMYDFPVYYESWCPEEDQQILRTICGQLSQFKYLGVPYTPGPPARDGSHCGFETHQGMAENTFEKIKNDLN